MQSYIDTLCNTFPSGETGIRLVLSSPLSESLPNNQQQPQRLSALLVGRQASCFQEKPTICMFYEAEQMVLHRMYSLSRPHAALRLDNSRIQNVRVERRIWVHCHRQLGSAPYTSWYTFLIILPVYLMSYLNIAFDHLAWLPHVVF